MPSLRALTSLNLRKCEGMGCAGVSALAEGVAEAAELSTIIIDECNIGDEGALALLSALLVESRPRPLRLLCAGNNAFGHEAGVALRMLAPHGIVRL